MYIGVILWAFATLAPDFARNIAEAQFKAIKALVKSANEQLEKVEDRKNILMNLLASELRDPIRSVGISAELRESGALNDELMVEQTCRNLSANVQRLSKLISDFRNLSLATSSKLPVEM